jgi:hypothetical protein
MMDSLIQDMDALVREQVNGDLVVWPRTFTGFGIQSWLRCAYRNDVRL